MSHDQLHPKRETTNLPPIDETVQPEAQFQFQPAEGMSAQKVEEKLKKADKAEKKRKRLIRVSLASGALVASTVVFSTFAEKIVGAVNGSDGQSGSDQATSGPLSPGEWKPSSDADYVPSDQVPYLRDTDPSAEVIKDPAVLTDEQISVWQSGDARAQTDLASNIIAPRISYAVHELYDAKKQGMTADVSWFTTDPATLEELDRVADQFIEVSDQMDPAEGVEWFGFDVCRTDTQENMDAALDICHLNNFPEGTTADLSEGNPMQFVVTRETSASAEDVEGNARYYEFDNSTVRLKGDTLVVEPLNN